MSIYNRARDEISKGFRKATREDLKRHIDLGHLELKTVGRAIFLLRDRRDEAEAAIARLRARRDSKRETLIRDVEELAAMDKEELQA